MSKDKTIKYCPKMSKGTNRVACFGKKCALWVDVPKCVRLNPGTSEKFPTHTYVVDEDRGYCGLLNR